MDNPNDAIKPTDLHFKALQLKVARTLNTHLTLQEMDALFDITQEGDVDERELFWAGVFDYSAQADEPENEPSAELCTYRNPD